MFRRMLIHALPVVVLFFVHYLAVHVYASLCAPLSFMGFFQTVLTLGSPLCNFLLNMISQSHTIYAALIVAAATFAGGFLVNLQDRVRAQAP
jgi:hypothetical protein